MFCFVLSVYIFFHYSFNKFKRIICTRLRDSIVHRLLIYFIVSHLLRPSLFHPSISISSVIQSALELEWYDLRKQPTNVSHLFGLRMNKKLIHRKRFKLKNIIITILTRKQMNMNIFTVRWHHCNWNYKESREKQI